MVNIQWIAKIGTNFAFERSTYFPFPESILQSERLKTERFLLA